MAATGPLEDAVQFAKNPEPRCPCVLLLDTSGSMEGVRIRALSAGLQTFRDDLVNDTVAAKRVEVAIVTFDSQVRVIQDFVTVDNFHPPSLQASGTTHMAGGIQRALNLIDARKETYYSSGVLYYRPWVFMITDGEPEGEPEETVTQAAQRLRADENAKRVAFFAVAVDGADLDRLTRIVQREVRELKGLDFRELFQWLSASMQSVSKSQPGDEVPLPPTSWAKKVANFVVKHENEIKAGMRVLRVVLGS